jgi:RNA polymerase sigma-70 factor, ECF subfamily
MFKKTDTTDLVIGKWIAIQKKVYWVVVNIINDKQLAEDAIQEALLIAIDKYDTLKDPAKFEPWFIKIAVRISYSMVTGSNRAMSCGDEDLFDLQENNGGASHFVEDTFLEPEYKELVHTIISKLEPPNRKYLFYLRYIEGKTVDEISLITGMKEGTLKSVFYRMRSEIGTLLERECNIYG